VVPSALPRHQLVSQKVALLLEAYAAAHGGTLLVTPIDVVFTEYDVLMPDLVFFVEDRKHLVPLDAPIRHAPDLVVEILSPSTAATDRGRKMQTFARHGVREYWIIDPAPGEERLEIYTLPPSGYELAPVANGVSPIRSPLLPELDAPIESLFPRG
jgi:Uma2 family endonuclease